MARSQYVTWLFYVLNLLIMAYAVSIAEDRIVVLLTIAVIQLVLVGYSIRQQLRAVNKNLGTLIDQNQVG